MTKPTSSPNARNKLYLSSYRIPTPSDLAQLLGKSLTDISVALIPNAKDYYAQRAWKFKVGSFVSYMQDLGMKVTIVDLREYSDTDAQKNKLTGHDLIWAMGGNTFILRYEMRRSGFDAVIGELLAGGAVYGGDSAGALVAGISIAGVESADEPEFAEEIIEEGLGLVPFVILPHVDSPGFAGVPTTFRNLHKDKQIIELKDSQAAIFNGSEYQIVEARVA